MRQVGLVGGSWRERRDADSTNVTLLAGLRDDPRNQAMWREFDRSYRPLIYEWCLGWRLQPADAEDVTQAVLARLVEKMRTFRYDPSQNFRGWLWTVTRRVVAGYLSRRRRAPDVGGEVIAEMLAKIEAREEIVRAAEAGHDRELLEEALRRVRGRVPSQQWDAFRLTALESRSGADASKELGMLVSTVYSSKCKVQKLVGKELRRLDGG
jgi:RNA polymerase sigma-70 factor (ECF subfamily)